MEMRAPKQSVNETKQVFESSSEPKAAPEKQLATPKHATPQSNFFTIGSFYASPTE
jgi:hypothetical protein